jgi:hypothetical protein
MISQLRLQQQRQQMAAIRPTLAAQPIATYKDRDPVTGRRNLLIADGGAAQANYLSESEPETVPFYSPSGAFNTPGSMVSR